MSIGIGLIGCGVWGKHHARELSSMSVLRAVHDSNPEAYPNIVDLYTIYNDPTIHGVVIATPPRTHCDLALAALQAGKHVLVEKPMTVAPHDAKMLRRVAQAADRILMVGHIMRYHEGFVRLLSIAQGGHHGQWPGIGSIEYVYTNRLQSGRIRTEENSLWSLAPHDLSMLIALCGLPERVSCVGSPLRGDQADIVTAQLAWLGGVRGHLFVSWLHPRKERMLCVIGSKGSVALRETGTTWDVALNGNLIDSGVTGNPLRTELEHFVHCIETDTRPLTDGTEGEQVVKVLAAAQGSMDADSRYMEV